MTDAITDAVRRLKGLQEDVERLQSEQDEQGEPRLLFSIQEQAVATDQLADLRLQRRVEDQGIWNEVGWSTASYGGGEDSSGDRRRRRRSGR
jgi:hypothetical protein